MAGKPGQQGRKPRAIPDRYKGPGFLALIDRRYRPAKAATVALGLFVQSLGGDLSPQQMALAERATWLHVRLQEIEQAYLAGQGLDAPEYSQLTGTLLAVLKALGLKREARRVLTLKERLQK